MKNIFVLKACAESGGGSKAPNATQRREAVNQLKTDRNGNRRTRGRTLASAVRNRARKVANTE